VPSVLLDEDGWFVASSCERDLFGDVAQVVVELLKELAMEADNDFVGVEIAMDVLGIS